MTLPGATSRADCPAQAIAINRAFSMAVLHHQLPTDFWSGHQRH
jgi:hypothetical protein